MAATTEVACVTPPAGIMYSAFARAMAVFRPMGATHGCPRWALSDRWQEMFPIWRCCWQCRPVTMPVYLYPWAGMGRYFKGDWRRISRASGLHGLAILKALCPMRQEDWMGAVAELVGI